MRVPIVEQGYWHLTPPDHTKRRKVIQHGIRTRSTSIAEVRGVAKSSTTKISTAPISLSQCNSNVERKWVGPPYISGAPKYRLAKFHLATFLGTKRGDNQRRTLTAGARRSSLVRRCFGAWPAAQRW